jgi:hypothetical protein
MNTVSKERATADDTHCMQRASFGRGLSDTTVSVRVLMCALRGVDPGEAGEKDSEPRSIAAF